MTALAPRPPNLITPLTPSPDADKDTRYRLGKYLRWIGDHWLQPDLALYHNFLKGERLKPNTIAAQLTTVRKAYRALIKDRDLFVKQARILAPDAGRVELKAIIDEVIIRIENAIDPETVKANIKTIQDIPDADRRRLTGPEADELLSLPDLNTLLGQRDVAMISALLCTGLREGELVALQVDDLYHTFDGEPAILIKRGKGNKQRVVPYGDLVWCRDLVSRWLAAAGISTGPIFRAFWKGCKKVRPHAITTSGVEIILRRYPFLIAGVLDYVRPHDLRHTYACLMYKAGVDLVAIQQNLGHSSLKTTLHYIGPLDAQQRRPPSIFADISRE